MKLKIFFACFAATILIACGNNNAKKETGNTEKKTTESKSWSKEKIDEEIKNCITSMMFKKSNDSLPEETKKQVCECSVNAKMARFPDEKTANINMASEMGIENMQQFRDSCIKTIVK